MKKFTPFTNFLGLMLLVQLCTAQNGVLDPTFGTNGSVEFSPQLTSEYVQSTALTSDGKLLIMIKGNHIARLLPNGKPDSGFAGNGILNWDSKSAYFEYMIVDDSNRILVLAFNSQSLAGFVYRFMSDGSLDENFGTKGHIKVKMSYAGNQALAVQLDGKILVGGASVNDFGFDDGNSLIMRFNNDGTEDATFNTNSEKAFKNLFEEVDQILVQPDDNIVFTASETNVGRLLSDGNFDIDFGTHGLTQLAVGDTIAEKQAALTIDSKIVLAGLSQDASGNSWNCWRLNSNGSRDASFGDDGLVKLFPGEWSNEGSFIIPQNDTTLIVGGTVFNGLNLDPQLVQLDKNGHLNGAYGNHGTAGKTFKCKDIPSLFAERANDGSVFMCGTNADNGSDYCAVSKFLPNGFPDNTYGTNGTTSVILPDSSFRNGWVDDFTFLPDDKILTVSDFYGLTINRLLPEGRMDSSFGKNGSLIPDVSFITYNLHFASNNLYNYIVEDYSPYFFGIVYHSSLVKKSPFLVFRLSGNGNIDTTYGLKGINYPVIPGFQWGRIEDAAEQDDGKLLVCGQVLYGTNSQTSDAYIIRLDQKGSVDSSFGNNGMLLFDWSAYDDGTAISIRSDGKILLATSFYGNDDFVHTKIIRLLPNGVPDSSFAVDGVTTINYSFAINEMIVQPDKKVLLNGENYASGYHFYIARLNEDGNPDSSFGKASVAEFIPDSSNYIDPDGRIALQDDGKIDMSGSALNTLRFYTLDIIAAQLRNDGMVDSAFATNGDLYLGFSGDDVGKAIHIQNDGKIVIGGSLQTKLTLIRLTNAIATVAPNIPKTSFAVFPNPFHNNIFIKPLSVENDVTITIQDMLGHILRIDHSSLQNNSAGVSLDLGDLPYGVFLITLQSGSSVYSSMIVKE